MRRALLPLTLLQPEIMVQEIKGSSQLYPETLFMFRHMSSYTICQEVQNQQTFPEPATA